MSYAVLPPNMNALVQQPQKVDPDVVSLAVNLRDDLYGQPALFFQVVLSKKFPFSGPMNATNDRLRHIIQGIWARLQAQNIPLQPYFQFMGEDEVNSAIRSAESASSSPVAAVRGSRARLR